MRVAIIGYGKMGQSIEKILVDRGHEVTHKINIDNAGDIDQINSGTADVAIEFTSPETAAQNIQSCITSGVPIVSGSTGWLDRYDEMVELCQQQRGAFFYASNYSLGVNIFFKLNQVLARLMNGRGYESSMVEIHHTQKLDAPSGTAITLAEGMIAELDEKKDWVNKQSGKSNELGIVSERTENVPGTHTINYHSAVDDITISHVAHSRQGFALGAVFAAEWIIGKVGVFSMDDMLGLRAE